MSFFRRAACIGAVAALAGCGSTGGSTVTPTAPGVPATTGPVTVTLSGTTRQTSINGCGGDVHDFTAAAGDVSVTLLETTDPAGALSVQVCSGNDVGSNCAIRQQKILVNQTLAGARVGSASQTLKLLPHACVFTSSLGPAAVTYRVSLTYQQ